MNKIEDQNIRVGIYEIDKEDADLALEYMSENQRALSETSARNLVSEINQGRFGISNDALVVTESGVWINGLHRLTAISRTGKNQSLLVMTIPDSLLYTTMRIMDGGKTRSIADVAKIESGIKNPGAVASIAKFAIAYGRGLVTAQGCYASTNRTSQDKYVSRGEVLDYIKAHAERLQYSACFVKSLNGEHGLHGVAGPGVVHYLISQKYSQKIADEFITVLFSRRGNGFEILEPYSKRITKDLKSITKIPSALKTASIARLFIAWKNNKPVRHVVASPGDAFPRI